MLERKGQSASKTILEIISTDPLIKCDVYTENIVKILYPTFWFYEKIIVNIYIIELKKLYLLANRKLISAVVNNRHCDRSAYKLMIIIRNISIYLVQKFKNLHSMKNSNSV